MKSKKHYKRGKNPNSHKGVSKEERQLLGTSTHAKEAKIEYKDFDWQVYEARLAQKERDNPYKMLSLSFYRQHPGEPMALYDEKNGKPIQLYFEIEQFKDLEDFFTQFRAIQEENEKLDYPSYLPIYIDLQTNRAFSDKLHPKQNIKGWKYKGQSPNRKDFGKGKSEQDEYEGACSYHYIQEWAYGYLKEIGEIKQ